MQPSLLMNAWSAAHFPSLRHQALLCCAGNSGEGAFRESLQGQYTSDRHRSKGLCAYHITGTAGNAPFSRITMGGMVDALQGLDADLRVRVASSSDRWVGEPHGFSQITMIPMSFLHGCSALTNLDLTPLSSVIEVGPFFLYGCMNLTTLDLTPLSNVKVIHPSFLGDCRGLRNVDRKPLQFAKKLR